MSYPSNPWQLAGVGCAILSAAEGVLGQFGYLPTYRYVAPKQGDWECCSNLVVVPLDSLPVDSADPKCSTMRTYRWSIEVGVCVNESLTCNQVGDCCDLPTRFDPCSTPFPSKSAESRFLLGLRWVLERGLSSAVSCAINDGVDCEGKRLGVRCNGARVAEATTVTEGACHIVLVTIETDL